MSRQSVSIEQKGDHTHFSRSSSHPTKRRKPVDGNHVAINPFEYDETDGTASQCVYENSICVPQLPQ